MKNLFKFLAIIALVAVIGFSFSACDPINDDGGTSHGGIILRKIDVTTPPAKTKYKIGEELDTKGMVVTATYSDKTTKAVTGYIINGFDSLTAGPKDITVTYRGKTSYPPFKVEVIPVDIQIVATPTANPAGGVVARDTPIVLTTTTDGTEIWYTTNGSAPAKDGTGGSTKFTGEFPITPPVTVKAIAVKLDSPDWIDSEILEAQYDATPITAADITIIAPTNGATPVTTAFEAENFTSGAVTWSPDDTTFKGSTVYTATVTLTARPGYTFAGLTNENVKVNGEPATITVAPDGDTLDLSFTFPATGAKIVSSIEITTQPAKLTYTHGEQLDLSGLAVKLTYDDTTTDTVFAADFPAKGITAAPMNGGTLGRTTNNGSPVSITYGDLTPINTGILTVNAKDISISGFTVGEIVAQTYNKGTEITPAVTVTAVSTGTSLTLGNDYTVEYFNNKNVGTAMVTITGKDNYTGTKNVTFVINKANPVTTWPTAESITFGQALSDSEFLGGASEAGIFTWQDNTIKPNVGSTPYIVTFTPTDTANYNIVTNTVSITVKISPITAANITINAPANGATPATTATVSASANFTSGTVTWSPLDTAFKGSTAYTATVTLTAKPGYTFAGLTNVTVNGVSASITNTPGNTLALSYTFPATDAKKVLDIVIKTQPTNMIYTHGDPLDLSGLVVTLKYDDGSNEDVAAADFSAKGGITTAPINGAALGRTLNNGKPVSITYGGLPSKDTNNLTVNPKSVSGVTVDPIPAKTYTGAAFTPSVTVKDDGILMVLDTHYTVLYSNNVNAGQATIFINGKDDYTGIQTMPFTIDPKNITGSGVTITGGTSKKTYIGSAITQDDITISYASASPILNKDYTVAYSNNTNAGLATITITGTGNFTGSTTINFTIEKANSTVTTWPSAADIIFGQKLSASTFSGGSTTPAGTFAWTDGTIEPNAGPRSYDVTFTPADSNNYKSVTGGPVSVKVAKADPSISKWPSAASITNGAELSTSALSGAVHSTPGSFAWTNPTNVVPPFGTNNSYSVTFTPTDTNNYNTVTNNVSITVVNSPITAANITINAPTNGATPATTATVSASENFTSGTVSWSPLDTAFKGSTAYTATVTLTAKTGYTFTGSTNVKVNGASASITGAPGNTLTLSYTFPATGARTVSGIAIKTQPAKMSYTHGDTLDLSGLVVMLTYDDKTTEDVAVAGFSAKGITAAPINGATLGRTSNHGKPVSITYGDLTPITTGNLIVERKSVSGFTVGAIAAETYTGIAITPSVTVKDGDNPMTLGTHYTVAYSDNINAGTAKVTITGIGDYIETTTVTFSINTRSIAGSDVTISGGTTTMTYTGSAITQNNISISYASAKLTSGTDYTVAYQDNTNAGTATIIITGKGNFSGSKTINFTIDKANSSITKLPTAAPITYGAALSTSKLTDGVGSVPGTFEWTTGTIFPDAGPHSYEVTFKPTGTNHNTVTGTVIVTVDKANPTVTWPSAAAITYGALLSASALSGGTGAGNFAWTDGTIKPTVSNTGYSVTFTPTDTENYNNATGKVSITVTKANPSITNFPTATGITYGAALSTSALNGGAGSPAGTFAWANGATVPNAGTHSLDVTFTPTDTANYNSVTVMVSITVAKATALIGTPPTALDITYGQALSDSKLSGGSATPSGGTFTWTYPDTKPGVGTAPQSITYTPSAGNQSNYDSVTGNVSVTVNKAAASIVTLPTATSITAGQKVSDSSLSGGVGSPAGGKFSWVTPDTPLGVGTSNQMIRYTPSTADQANYNTVTGYVIITVKPKELKFSHNSGLYSGQFSLTLTGEAGDKIYYTTDGSIPVPNKTGTTEYSSPITVKDRTGEANVLATPADRFYMDPSDPRPDKPGVYRPSAAQVPKATVIRAIRVEGNNKSDVVTKTYFIGTNLNDYGSTRVLSLVSDPDNLVSEKDGIMVRGPSDRRWNSIPPYNFRRKGSDWEREAYLEIFDGVSEGDNRNKASLSTGVGIRIRGGYSRGVGQKSFSVYFKEQYGIKNLKDYALIPKTDLSTTGAVKADGTPVSQYKSFMLRNGANDIEYTKFYDVFLQDLLSDRSFSTQASVPCVVYLNGEYWGPYNFQERYSDNHTEYKYGVDKDNVISYDNGELDDGNPATDANLYQNMVVGFANKDMSNSTNYADFCKLVDIDNYIDYCAAEIYIYNEDWPHNNYRAWRTREVEAGNPYGDTKWRWQMFDTEFALGIYNDGNLTGQGGVDAFAKIFNNVGKPNTSEVITPDVIKDNYDNNKLFKALLKNPDFCRKFVNTMLDLYNVNFHSDNYGPKLTKYTAVYKPLMNGYFSRWGQPWGSVFDDKVRNAKKYLDAIGSAMVNTYLPKYFGGNSGYSDIANINVGTLRDVTVSTSGASGATIKVNTVTPKLGSGSWTGKYYSGVPITVTASPTASGKTFKGWTVTGGTAATPSATTTTVTLTGNATITATY
jgi:hypothetical protein